MSLNRTPLSKLPDGPHKTILLEAEARGVRLTSPAFPITDLLLIGLADMVAEMRTEQFSHEKTNRP